MKREKAYWDKHLEVWRNVPPKSELCRRTNCAQCMTRQDCGGVSPSMFDPPSFVLARQWKRQYFKDDNLY